MVYNRIGDFIRLIDNRNTDLAIDKLVGLTIDKKFIPSVANIIGTDLSKYKVIRKEQFACSLMQVSRDGKMPVAMFKEDVAIMSPAYPMFEVKDTNRILPEYLMMYFSRPEFDREAVFYAVGGVRGSLEWEDFCNIKIPVPSIEEQRRIVNEYQTVERRIANNEKLIQKLEETAQAIYYHTFVEGIDENNLPEGWRMGCLGDCGDIITGKTPSSDNPEDFGEYIQFMTPVDFHSYNKYIISTERRLSLIGKKRLTKKFIPKESVIVTCIGSDMGKVAINYEDCISNQQINSIVLSHHDYKDYIFYYLHSKREEIRAHAAGSSTMLMLNKDQFEKFGIIIPPKNTAQTFSQKIMPVNSLIKSTSRELIHLRELLSLLTSKLA